MGCGLPCEPLCCWPSALVLTLALVLRSEGDPSALVLVLLLLLRQLLQMLKLLKLDLAIGERAR